MKNIVYSFLGTSLDRRRRGGDRWSFWRPSIALVMQENLCFDEYHIWYQKQSEPLLQEILTDIGTVSPETIVVPELINLADPWDFEEVYAKLYDFSQSQKFVPEENNYYIHITTGTHVAQICLFLLNESHHLHGTLIQTRPAFGKDTVRGKYSLIDLNLSRYDQLAKRFEANFQNDLAFLKSGIDTKNSRFNSLIETIERVAVRSQDPILLTGQTGVGKSRLARRIYDLKKLNHQVQGKFVEVNCATLRGDQAMSTLFGHTKGAFTGAMTARSGLLKMADGGMLFLDEVGELGLDEQAMLLRAIEEKKFMPLGADVESASAFQLICGTNRNLDEEVANGRFRDDLYQRINLWKFHLPGLAERREDIAPNVEYELDDFMRRTGKRVIFNSEAWKAFQNFALIYPWKGNFRELNAVITRLATLSTGGRIDESTVNAEIKNMMTADNDCGGVSFLQDLLGEGYENKYDYFDLVQLAAVVKVCMECRCMSAAGRRLFAVSRELKTTCNDADRLARYLARFSLRFSDIGNRSQTQMNDIKRP